jgi:ribosome-binding factor A
VAGSLRIKRLEQQVLALVDHVVRRRLSDPRIGSLTITRAELSKDLETCEVFWCMLEGGPRRTQTEKALESARGFIQREVAAALALRVAPKLRFHWDKGFEAASRVQELIGRARAEDEARRKEPPPVEDAPS